MTMSFYPEAAWCGRPPAVVDAHLEQCVAVRGILSRMPFRGVDPGVSHPWRIYAPGLLHIGAAAYFVWARPPGVSFNENFQRYQKYQCPWTKRQMQVCSQHIWRMGWHVGYQEFC